MLIRYKRVVVVLLWLVALCAEAQRQMIVHRRYTSDDGLSHSWIRCIYQDELGFLWIGTKDGLNRFDGVEFNTYLANDEADNWLQNNTILDIKPFRDHQLFVCTGAGAYLFDYIENRFQSIGNIPQTEVYTVAKDHNGIFWFGTSNGVFGLDGHFDLVKRLTTKPSESGLSNDVVSSLFVDKMNRLWVGTINGLNVIDLAHFTNQVCYLDQPTRLPPGSAFSKMVEDVDGNIFIAITGYGVDYCKAADLGNGKLQFHHLVDGSGIDMVIDKHNYLWVANTRSFGVYQLKVNPDFSCVKKEFVHMQGDPNCISGNNTDCIFEDRWGDIWIGTYMQGLNHLTDRSPNFKSVVNRQFGKPILGNNVVNSFWDDGQYVWIGTEKGVSRMDEKTRCIEPFEDDLSERFGLSSCAIYNFYSNSKEQMWIGTWAGGLYGYDASTKQLTKFLHDPSDSLSIPSNNVYDIEKSNDGRLWLGLIRGQFGWFDPLAKRFHTVTDPLGQVNTNNICEIEKDGDQFWLSTYNNAVLFDPATHQFTPYPSLRKGGDLVDIYRDSKGNMWFGSESGLVVLTADRKRQFAYTTENGLISNSIKAIEEDAKQNLWISTNKGLSKFVDGVNLPRKPFFRNFYVNDGLQGSEFNVRSSCKTQDGNLYFGGVNGFTYFHPDSTVENSVVPPVYITGVLSSADSVRINQRNVYIGDTIVVQYDKNSFSISFSALNYLASSENKYRYKLENWERKWVEGGARRIVSYSNVAPGTYRFLVTACNNDGYWNKIPAQLVVVVLAPWWLSWWFKVLVAAIVFFVVWQVYRFRVRMLKHQKTDLEFKVGERTNELIRANALLAAKQHEISQQNEELYMHRIHLEELVSRRTAELGAALQKAEESDRLKSAFLANMSHEIRTPMNAIVGFSSLVAEEITDPTVQGYIDIINDNCQSLLVLINDIIDLSLIESEHLKIVPTNVSLKRFFDSLKQQYSHVKSEVPVEYNGPTLDRVLCVDEIRLKQLFNNLIDNAIKYTHSGKVDFGYRVEDGYVCFYVADTGIGIAPDKLEFLFSPFGKIEAHNQRIYRGTGLGLSICRRLVEVMGGQIWVESKVDHGTTFFFTLPIP